MMLQNLWIYFGSQPSECLAKPEAFSTSLSKSTRENVWVAITEGSEK